jgi:hypothetical protein
LVFPNTCGGCGNRAITSAKAVALQKAAMNNRSFVRASSTGTSAIHNAWGNRRPGGLRPAHTNMAQQSKLREIGRETAE